MGILGRPAVKGWIGEMLLRLRLRQGLDCGVYHLIHNLILPTPDGTTQVDHVVVSRHGIFVIETKHYGGWIFGGERDRMWTQTFGRRKFSFQNPLRQNFKHVRALAELVADIGIDERALFSLVVFIGDCTFKTPMPDNVMRPGACLARIRAHGAALLGEAQVEAVIERIAGGRVAPSRAANAAHARHVQALLARRKDGPAASGMVDAAPRAAPAAQPAAAATARVEPRLPADAPTPALAATAAAPCCPRCGGALDDYTYRSGARSGQAFRGCVRFPDCNYRVDLPAPSAAATAAASA